MSHVPALVISPRDNVATALEPLDRRADDRSLGGQSITVAEATPRGHKIALRPIRQRRADRQVRQHHRHAPRATSQPGSHVHTHNVASGRGRAPQNNTERHGSLIATQRRPTAASAEPPDRSPVTGRRPMSALTFWLSPAGRPRRRAQSRARGADGHLRVGRRGADRRVRSRQSARRCRISRAAASSGRTGGSRTKRSPHTAAIRTSARSSWSRSDASR